MDYSIESFFTSPAREFPGIRTVKDEKSERFREENHVAIVKKTR